MEKAVQIDKWWFSELVVIVLEGTATSQHEHRREIWQIEDPSFPALPAALLVVEYHRAGAGRSTGFHLYPHQSQKEPGLSRLKTAVLQWVAERSESEERRNAER